MNCEAETQRMTRFQVTLAQIVVHCAVCGRKEGETLGTVGTKAAAKRDLEGMQRQEKGLNSRETNCNPNI